MDRLAESRHRPVQAPHPMCIDRMGGNRRLLSKNALTGESNFLYVMGTCEENPRSMNFCDHVTWQVAAAWSCSPVDEVAEGKVPRCSATVESGDYTVD